METRLAIVYQCFKNNKIASSQIDYWSMLAPDDPERDKSYYSNMFKAERKYKKDLAIIYKHSAHRMVESLSSKFIQNSKNNSQRQLILGEIIELLKQDDALLAKLEHTNKNRSKYWRELQQAVNKDDYTTFFNHMLSLIIFDDFYEQQSHLDAKKLRSASPYSFAKREHIDEFTQFTLMHGISGYSAAVALYNQVENYKSENPLFLYELGELYFYGKYSFAPNIERAYQYFQRAAIHNHPLAIWSLGQITERQLISVMKNNSSSQSLHDSIKLYKEAIELDCFQAMINLGKIYLRALYYLANERNVFVHAPDCTNLAAYEAVGPNSRGIYCDPDFEKLINNFQPGHNEQLIEIENRIISTYFRPAIDKYDYFYACACIATILKCRMDRSVDPLLKQAYNEQLMDYYRLQADIGEPWAANSYALILENKLKQSEQQDDELPQQAFELQKILDLYHKSAFQYFTKKEQVWPLLNWSRMVISLPQMSAEKQERAEEYLCHIMKNDSATFKETDSKKRLQEAYSLLTGYYKRNNMDHKLQELKKNYSFIHECV